MLRAGFAIVGLVVAAAVLSPLLPIDPAHQELALRLAGPTLTHPFGLDELGRDVLARVLAGARLSLLVAVVVVGASAAVGAVLGAVAGYLGGVWDEAISRVIDVLLAFPGLLLAISLVAVLGPSLGSVLVALSIIGWVGYARLVRGQVLRIRELEYVQAAGALGAGTVHVLRRHILPSVVRIVLAQATLGMAGAVIGEAALSFLGLGVQPPTPSWGSMLSAGRVHFLDAPHLTLFPGFAIALLVLGFHFLGDGLSDRVPSARSSIA